MKKIALSFIMIMLSSFVYAAEIYVEQAGDTANININQEGIGNIIGDSLNPAYFGGDLTIVNIDQIGDGNTLTAVVNGAGTTTTVNTVGTGNVQSINCGSLLSATCAGSVITQAVTGNDNTITQSLGNGGSHTSNITVNGNDNNVTHTSTNSTTSTANITVDGSTNTVGVTQSGLTAKTVSVTTTGSGNNVTINQSE